MKNCLDRLLSELDALLSGLPMPLLPPVWYPINPDEHKLLEALEKVRELLRRIAEVVIRQIQEEGLFDENPIIRVYPRYPEASGIVIFYKGEKVLERWLNVYEMDWGDRQSVGRETKSWYEEVYRSVQHDEGDPFYGTPGPPWEHLR